MKTGLVSFGLLILSLSSCKVKPEACFTIDKPKQDLHAKTDIKFTSCSDNAKTLRWNFGDGGTAEGVQVVHLYTLPGQYRVSLTAVNSDRSDEVIETITIAP
jgi:PKD repeat protein